MTFTHEEIDALPGTVVRDRSGELVGTIEQVWADTAGQPTWVSVDDALMPLPGSYLEGGQLRTPYDRAVVRSAPAVDVNSDDPLASNGLRDLYAHYAIRLDDSSTDDAGASDDAGTSDDGTMIRSEERLGVRTEEQQTRVRLRKYVVTEYVTTTVPVRREEVRLERVPVGESDPDGEPVDAGTEVSESEHEIILHAERPVVTTETVPVERVRLGKETVTENQTVGAEVRKERIEADLPDGSTRAVD